MSRIYWDEVGAFLLAILVIVFLLWGFVSMGIGFDLETKCLQAGYKDYHLTWNWQKYCSREENEYEIVVPYKDVR